MSCATGTSIGLFWFQLTAEADSVRITTCNSVAALGGDSVFALYEGDTSGPITEVACSEDGGCQVGGGPWLGTIDYCDMVIGGTYLIQFASWAAVSQGIYQLDVLCPSPICAPAACCLSDGSCITASPSECAAANGTYSGAGVFCQGDANSNGLDDTCEQGACCQAPDGTCAMMTQDECTAMGGLDFIPATSCTPNDPCQGACCVFNAFPPPGSWSCTDAPNAVCPGTWYEGESCGAPGGSPPWFECPDDAVCTLHPEQDSNCQEPAISVAVARSTGVVSDTNNNDDPLGPGASRAADGFVPQATGIAAVCWWGHYQDLDTSGGSPGAGEPGGACNPASDSFTVTYYTDNGGCPGSVVASFSEAGATLTVQRTTAGGRDPNGHLVYEYEGTHAPVTVTPFDSYWLEIVNDTGVDICVWVWAPAPFAEGNGYAVTDDSLPAAATYDCTPNCPSCSEVLPFDLAWCLNVPNEPRDCLPFCPGDPEGEPVCINGYQDTYNSGCDAAGGPGPFTPIACGQTICGTHGTYQAPDDCTTNSDCPVPEVCSNGLCTGSPVPQRDTDWYRFVITGPDPVLVELCVTGEASTLFGIVDTGGQDVCPPTITWAATVVPPAPCVGACAGTTLPPGTWYGYVSTAGTTGIPCGTKYTATLKCPTGCGCVDARSLHDHGAGDLALNMGCAGGIEPRFGGVAKLKIDLDDAAAFGGGVTVDCVPTAYSGTATHTGTVGNTVTITFAPGLPDQTKCNITLDCGATVCVRNLEGDSNRDGATNPVDNNQRLLRFGMTAAAAGGQWDVNVDGNVNPVDNNQTLLRFGNTAPSCP